MNICSPFSIRERSKHNVGESQLLYSFTTEKTTYSTVGLQISQLLNCEIIRLKFQSHEKFFVLTKCLGFQVYKLAYNEINSLNK